MLANSLRDPIQVYLTPTERRWLDELAAALGVSRSEVLRRGVRRLRGELRPAESAMSRFLAQASADPGLSVGPTDMAARHDDYLVDGYLDRGDATGAP
jgi:Arc/MetJ-type ribon-helix-helix transcriptional regulator